MESNAPSLAPLFRPRSVAVVGASPDPANLGHRVLRALTDCRFQGPVYPVHPRAPVVCSMRAYPSVGRIPEPVDLAIIVVPRDAVLAVIDDCIAHGVKAAVVITAGFAEMDDEGRRIQETLTAKVRAAGMRVVGPNCMGILNTDPAISLNASFSPVYPLAGAIAMSSQSGALGAAILGLAKRRGLGLSTFVSVGNKADVSGNDLLRYWEDDPLTNVILLYLESFGNPRRFARIARRIGRRKPIVAVKGGRTVAGIRAAGSHTAAMAAREVAVDALFHQTGVIRAETLEEMLDLAALLEHQPLPRGGRVAILTNAGGPAILCADMAESSGLTVAPLAEETRRHLVEFLPPAASVKNPVDMIASATPESYRRATEILLAADEVDAVIVICVPVNVVETETFRRGIAEGVELGWRAVGETKPVLACVMTEKAVSDPIPLARGRIPVYVFPEAAARALGKILPYAEWRARPAGEIPSFPDVKITEARAICRSAAERNGSTAIWLSAEETRAVLASMRLPLPPGGVARTADEAVAVARRTGFPVAVKLASREIVHKTEIGGVKLNLVDDADVRAAFADIRQRLTSFGRASAMDGVVVQSMMPADGVEVMVGTVEDPLFGPLIAFGLGGIHVEVLGDVRFRVTPLTDLDAREMIREIRGHKLLDGYRGHPPADIDALQDLLLRVSRLVEEVPEIVEMDCNPIFAFPPGKGCCIADARIRVRLA